MEKFIKTVYSAVFIGLLIIMSLCASGGNPLTSKHGSYLYWQEPTQTFYLDQGPLGTLDEKTAQQLVIDAFQEWSNVEYSDFRWEFGGILEENVTVENAARYIESATDGINLVILMKTVPLLTANME